MSIKNKSIRGSAFLALGIGFSQIVNFATILVISYFIDPQEYGIFSYGLIALAFTAIFAKLGLIEAIVQREKFDEDDVFSALILSGSLSIFSLLIMIIVGYAFSAIKNDYQYLYIFSVLGISSLSLGMQSVPESLLRRELNFSRISIIRAVATLISALVAIVMVVSGFGVWALVCQRLIHEGAIVLLLYLYSNLSIAVASSMETVSKLILFGKNIASYNVIDVFVNQVDQIFVGAFLGESELGIYAMAKRIVYNVRQILYLPIRQVLLAAVSIAKRSGVNIVTKYKEAIRLAGFVGVLPFFILALYSDDLANIIFSDAWSDVGKIIPILSLLILYDFIIIMYPSIVQSFDKSHWLVYERISIAVTGIAALAFGIQFGLVGAATAMVVQFFITMFIPLYMIKKIIRVNVASNFLVHAPYFICGLFSALSAYALSYAVPVDFFGEYLVIVSVIIMIIIYIALGLMGLTNFKNDVHTIFKALKGG